MQFCDLGFGPGVLAQFILEEKPGWTACGVDISPECVHYAEKLMKLKGINERVQFTTGDVRNLPYADSTFDLVLAMEVLEHISDFYIKCKSLKEDSLLKNFLSVQTVILRGKLLKN